MAATLTGGKILIPTRYQAENLGFLRSLPDARFVKLRQAWSVTPTPCTAFRIIERGYQADDAIHRLADQWILDVPDLVEFQPPVRKTESWKHQRQAYWFARNKTATMLALEMGCGKTKVTVDLLVNWGCKRVLILCPKSVLGVWPRELERHGPDDFHCCVLDKGNTSIKASRADAALAGNATKLCVVVLNYESAIQPAFAEWAVKQDWDCVVCDESHRIKEPSGKASKFCYEVGKKAKKRLCLTGTPLPHSPLDVFGQYRFLDAGVFGTNWVPFRTRYAVCSEQFKSQVLSWINQDELTEKYKQLAFRVRSADVLDLPPVIHERVTVELSPAALKAYRSLEEEMLVDLKDQPFESFLGQVVDGEVTTGNALVKLLRLQQIASGHVRTDDERVLEIDTAKAERLAEFLSDLPVDEPVVVFCQYRHNLEQVRRVAEATGRTYGEISGARKDLTDKATMPEGISLMAVQWQSGAVGIDLTRARYGVIYSATFNGGNFVQGLARQHRPGQTRTTFFYHLLAEGTVDFAVYGALEKRRLVTEAVSDGSGMLVSE